MIWHLRTCWTTARYSHRYMVPRLSYAIQNWCVSLLLFNRVHGNEYPYVYKSPVWGGSKSCVAVLYISYSVTSSSPCSKLCTLPRTIVINVAAAILVSNSCKQSCYLWHSSFGWAMHVSKLQEHCTGEQNSKLNISKQTSSSYTPWLVGASPL